MVAHRKNIPPGKAYVPSSWVIVLTVMVLIGGAGWLGWLLVDDDSAGASTATASPTVSAPSAAGPTSEPTPTADQADETPEPAETTPEPTEPEPTEPEPATRRASLVSVFNNSGITGAARTFSGRVRQAGWPIGGIGNWTGSIDGNTVYYPPGLQQQAQLLADDVEIQRVRPSVAPMRMDRLTVILSGPQ